MVRNVLVAGMVSCLAAEVLAETPLADAMAVWHFKDAKSSQPKDGELNVGGTAKIASELAGTERTASIAQGGDGFVAEVRSGGFLSATLAGEKSQLKGRELTILARVAILDKQVEISLLSIHAGASLPLNLYVTERDDQPVLGASIATTKNNGPLNVSVPLADLRKGDWHDVVCRLDGAKLELFVDGRCVDEDFMLGDLNIPAGPVLIGIVGSTAAPKKDKPAAQIDHIALWKRGLSNREIVTLAGGAEFADARARTDRGEPNESMQYWKPPNGYNVGDCFPFYHDGRFHFAYLIDKHHHRAKNGLGAHQWAQATSRDLVNWEHQPLTVPITEQWEGSICTGSFFFHDGVYYAFYATRSSGTDEFPMWHQYIAYATSRDGINFEKQEPNPLFPLPERYGPADNRDPVVFQDETGLFHMMITSQLRDGGGGCLVHMTSKDLKKWEEAKPIITGKGQPECPSHFEWNGKYYLTYGLGNGYYFVSDKPAGPWKKHEREVFCYGDAYVPKIAPYKDNRRLVCAWVPYGGWGGLSLWRELVARPDGSLGSRWPEELIPKTGKPLDVPLPHLTEKGRHPYADLPRDYRMTIEFDPAEKPSGPWGLRLRDDDQQAIELRVLPEEKLIKLGDHKVPWTEAIAKLDIIVKGPVVDVCIDDNETVVSGRAGDLASNRVVFFNEGSPVKVKSFTVRPLVE